LTGQGLETGKGCGQGGGEFRGIPLGHDKRPPQKGWRNFLKLLQNCANFLVSHLIIWSSPCLISVPLKEVKIASMKLPCCRLVSGFTAIVPRKRILPPWVDLVLGFGSEFLVGAVGNWRHLAHN